MSSSGRILLPTDLPAVRIAAVSKNADQTIPSGVWTDVTWQVEDNDPFGLVDLGTDDTLVSAPEAGLYYASVVLNWSGGAGSSRYISVGFTSAQITQILADAQDPFPIKTFFIGTRNQGAPIRLSVWQNSGSDKTLYGVWPNSMTVFWIGP